MENQEPAGAFIPRITLNLDTATRVQFDAALEEMEAYSQSLGALPPLQLKDGWYNITPQLAESWLPRNVRGANRPPRLPDVRYYAQQMLMNDWPKTGETIIFTDRGVLTDGQNRLLAGYFSGSTFDSYVVASVPHTPGLFAYIDNGRARSPSVALQTAGHDGQSGVIYGIARIERSVLSGAYTTGRVLPAARMSPQQVVRAAEADRRLHDAAHVTVADYGDAITMIGYKDLAAYVAYKITCTADEAVLDDFMREVGVGPSREDSPIGVLRRWLEANRRATRPRPKHIVLAYVIKAYNAWRNGETIVRLRVTDSEPFPVFSEEGAEEVAA